MRFFKVKELSIPHAIIIGSLIIGLSIFLTTWIFFGGDNNRQKLSTPTTNSRGQQPNANALTPQQIQMIQEQQQRAALLNQQRQQSTTSTSIPASEVKKPATTLPVTKTIKK